MLTSFLSFPIESHSTKEYSGDALAPQCLQGETANGPLPSLKLTSCLMEVCSLAESKELAMEKVLFLCLFSFFSQRVVLAAFGSKDENWRPRVSFLPGETEFSQVNSPHPLENVLCKRH